MKRLLLVALLSLLVARQAEAAIRYASPSGSGSACTVISTPCTLNTAISQLVAGDTLVLKDGTYNLSATLTNPLPSGTSANAYTSMIAENFGAAHVKASSGMTNIILLNANRRWIRFAGLDLDCENRVTGNDCQGFRISTEAVIEDLIFEDNIVQNCRNNCVVLGDATLRTSLRRNSIGPTTYTVAGTLLYNRGIDGVIERNDLHGGASCMTILSSVGGGKRNRFRYNKCRDEIVNPDTGGRGVNVTAGTALADANEISFNFFYNLLHKGVLARSSHTKIDNNTFWNVVGINVHLDTASTQNVRVRNNIMLAGGTAITDVSTAAVKQTNLTSGTPSAIFQNTATGDLCLKSTATGAINQGTAIVGFAFNGSAPDIGACETIDTAAITAVSTDSSIDILLPSNIAAFLPLLPASGITGFTLSDSRTVTSASRLSDSIIRLTYTGTCTGGTLAYTPGNVTDNARIGNLINQPLFAFSGKTIANDCGGGIPPPPPGLHISYALDDGSGTNANDGTANNLDGTLTAGPTWVSGHTGSAVYFAPSVQDYIAVPYGNAVNPSTQSLTIALAVLVDSNATAGTFNVLAAPSGTNQRMQIAAFNGTWSLGIQATDVQPNTEFPLTAAWTRLCVNLDSGTDTATLNVNGVAGTTPQSVIAYTSYALAGNIDIGRRSGVTNSFGFAGDDFATWTSVESCADDYAAWSPAAGGGTGDFTQVAYQFYLARKDAAGNLLKLPSPAAAINAPISIPAGGVVDMEIQVNCDNVANCDPLGMVLQRAPIGVDTWSDVSDADIGAASFYGTADGDSAIPSGVPTCPISGALTCVNGGTIRTANAVPTIDLGQNQSTVNRYIVKVNESSRFRLINQDRNVFGSYGTDCANCPTVNIVGAYAGF